MIVIKFMPVWVIPNLLNVKIKSSIFPIEPYLTYGWFPVGSHPNVKYEYKRKEKICVLGALNSEYFIYAFTDWLNGNVFKVFLQDLFTNSVSWLPL